MNSDLLEPTLDDGGRAIGPNLGVSGGQRKAHRGNEGEGD